MERIASFSVNHDTLLPGIYTSRVDGDVVTYDIRTNRPNSGQYLENDEIHTFEHLFATYARNSSAGDKIIYFGPMGCRTGFYLLVRDSLSPVQSIALVNEITGKIAAHDGEIPGVSEPECGNAAEHSLGKAKTLAARMLETIKDWTPEQLTYQN